MTERRVRPIRALRWRDTRLWIGIGLVVAAMVLGSRVLSGGDERMLVWAATSDMAAGAAPSQVALTPVALGSAARFYFAADQPPSGRLTAPVTTGALIPRAAVAPEPVESTERYVTIAVEANRVPHQLAPGHQVDVWSVGSDGEPTLVLASVLIEHVADDAGRGALAIVTRLQPADVGPMLAAMRTGNIDLVAVPVQ